MSSIKQFLNDHKDIYDELKRQNEPVEIEYRVKGFDHDSFMMLNDALVDISKTKEGWRYERTQIVDRIFKNNNNEDMENMRVSYDLHEKTPGGYDQDLHGIKKHTKASKMIGRDRLVISHEETQYLYDRDYTGLNYIKRDKNRDSFYVGDKDRDSFHVEDFIKIDLTIVDSSTFGIIEENGNKSRSYEVEIELLEIENNCIHIFEQIIKNIKKYLPNYEEVIDFFNKTMTGRDMKRDNLIYGTVSRARDLTFKDLVNYKETYSKGI